MLGRSAKPIIDIQKPVVRPFDIREKVLEELSALISSFEEDQKKVTQQIEKDYAKKYGQFFTHPSIARAMTSLIQVDKRKISILDPGAGMGILTLFSLMELVKQGCLEIEATLYEIDEVLIKPLNELFEKVVILFQKSEVKFSFQIIHGDFILDKSLKQNGKYDIAILNPPYFKINSKSQYHNATSKLYSGNPNIYASFVAMSLESLATKGQLIAITPRSFTNGLYFKDYRRYVLKNSNLTNVHSFVSRDKLFDAVLQEVLIYKLVKGQEQQEKIEIKTTHSTFDLEDPFVQRVDKNIIIDYQSSDQFIRILEKKGDLQLLAFVNTFPNTFDELGFFISTGELVQFRTKKISFKAKEQEHRSGHPSKRHHPKFEYVD